MLKGLAALFSLLLSVAPVLAEYSNVPPSSSGGGSGIGTVNGIVKGNGAGVASQAIAGTDYQAPSANLTALLALAGTGFTVKTGANTWAQRTILGTVNRISTTNADGIAGNVSVDISSLYTGQTSITTLGTIATGTWNGSVIGSLYGGSGIDASACSGVLLLTAGTAVCTGTSGTGTIARTISPTFTGTVASAAITASASIALTKNQAAPTGMSVTNTNAGAGSQANFSLAGPTKTSLFYQNADIDGGLYVTTPTLSIQAVNAAGAIGFLTGAGPTSRTTIDAAGNTVLNVTGGALSLGSAGINGVGGCLNSSGATPSVITAGSCGTGLPAAGNVGDVVLNTSAGAGNWFKPICKNMGQSFNGDGVTNNAAAWDALVVAVNAGTTLCSGWPAGTYLSDKCGFAFTPPVDAVPVFYGAGSEATIFKFTCASGSGGLSFTAASNSTASAGNAGYLHDFTMVTTAVAATSGSAIYINNKAQSGQASRPWIIENVNIRDDNTGTKSWNAGIDAFNTSQLHLKNVNGQSCNSGGTPCYAGTFIQWRSPLATVTGAANNGGGKVRLTVNSTADFYTGMVGTVSQIVGTTEANVSGVTFTVVDATHLDLLAINFVNAYMSGGYAGTIPTGLVIQHADGSYWQRGIYINGYHVEGAFVANSNMSFMTYAADVSLKEGTDCQFSGGQYNGTSAAINIAHCDGSSINGVLLIGQGGSGSVSTIVTDRTNITGSRLVCSGSYNGYVLGDGTSTQFNEITGSNGVFCGTTFVLAANANYNKVTPNMSVAPATYDLTDAGANNTTKCNAATGGAGTGLPPGTPGAC